jgi:hypothetical protein
MRREGALSIAVPWLVTLGLLVAVVVTGLGATSIDILNLPTLAFLLATAAWASSRRPLLRIVPDSRKTASS